ncbi:uncharacterized protein [Clytia hemisphaerica]|uniref:uncharacterized protein n=1 Tax=Clytia hemisphaerica TaxID=252671 RepID=UPI0034D3FD0B
MDFKIFLLELFLLVTLLEDIECTNNLTTQAQPRNVTSSLTKDNITTTRLDDTNDQTTSSPKPLQRNLTRQTPLHPHENITTVSLNDTQPTSTIKTTSPINNPRATNLSQTNLTTPVTITQNDTRTTYPPANLTTVPINYTRLTNSSQEKITTPTVTTEVKTTTQSGYNTTVTQTEKTRETTKKAIESTSQPTITKATKLIRTTVLKTSTTTYAESHHGMIAGVIIGIIVSFTVVVAIFIQKNFPVPGYTGGAMEGLEVLVGGCLTCECCRTNHKNKAEHVLSQIL